ncbi:MAG: hypothetical protein Kapaf2KO_01490 [Candidatus Kapaibacteriales bacterium]
MNKNQKETLLAIFDYLHDAYIENIRIKDNITEIVFDVQFYAETINTNHSQIILTITNMHSQRIYVSKNSNKNLLDIPLDKVYREGSWVVRSCSENELVGFTMCNMNGNYYDEHAGPDILFDASDFQLYTEDREKMHCEFFFGIATAYWNNFKLRKQEGNTIIHL